MKHSTRLFLVLMDGKPHHASEWMSFMKANVNPAVAARCYHAARRSPASLQGGTYDPATVPQHIALERGTRRSVMYCVSRLQRQGLITVTRHQDIVYHGAEEANDDFTVQLTPEGIEHVTRFGRGGSLALILKAMRQLIERRVITVSAKLNSGAEVAENEPDDEEPTEEPHDDAITVDGRDQHSADGQDL